MNRDDGEVLQGLDESWTFMGANIMEWAMGMVVFMMISLFAQRPGRAMPFMIAGWVGTTVSLATLRRSFPDEHRGVANALCTACGFPPVGIPRPSSLQPVWSAARVQSLPTNTKFVRLCLSEGFPCYEDELDESDDNAITEAEQG